jgi:hypothetical protein
METELSILVVQIFTLYLLAIGIGILSDQLNINKMMKGFEDSQALTLISGFSMLVIGALLVTYHNIWSGSWQVILATLLGWSILIKGFLFIAYPKAISSFKGIYKNIKPSFGLLPITLGIILAYFLFVA